MNVSMYMCACTHKCNICTCVYTCHNLGSKHHKVAQILSAPNYELHNYLEALENVWDVLKIFRQLRHQSAANRLHHVRAPRGARQGRAHVAKTAPYDLWKEIPELAMKEGGSSMRCQNEAPF